MTAEDPLAITMDRPWESASFRSRATPDEADPIQTASANDPQAGPTASPHPSSDLAGGLIMQMERWIRRYPWPTVLIGIGLGFLLARRTRF